jgi:hypothetical protein
VGIREEGQYKTTFCVFSRPIYTVQVFLEGSEVLDGKREEKTLSSFIITLKHFVLFL